MAAPAWATCQLRFNELAITMQGLRPLLNTKINGAEMPVMLGSGAFYTLLTRRGGGAPGPAYARYRKD